MGAELYKPVNFAAEMDSEVPREEKMLYSGTNPESYITEQTLAYE